MKTILSVILIVLMSLSIVTCDNPKNEQETKLSQNSNKDEERLIKLFRDTYYKKCLGSVHLSYEICECAYSGIIKKYPGPEIIKMILRDDKKEKAEFLRHTKKVNTECANK